MSKTDPLPADHDEPKRTEIRVQGHLDARWADWFEGMIIMLEENGDTRLVGPVADQAALYGLLKKVRDLGLPLLLVMHFEPNLAELSDVKQTIEGG